MTTFRAIAASEPGPATLQELTDADLPAGDVTIAVAYSSLNYKDGLAVTGKGKIMRSHPMIAGIDLAGVVEASDSPDWKPGDEVLVTGWGLSETRSGGFTQRQRVTADLLTAKPAGLTLEQTMAIGTAGLTAMLCVLALESNGVAPGNGEVIVTGAGGGVGSVAVAVLAISATRSPRRPAAPRRTTTCGRWGRRRSSTGPSWPLPADRSTRSAGPAASTRWGARRWRPCSPRPSTGVPSRRVGSPVGAICRPRCCRSSCATWRCSASIRCRAQRPCGTRRGVASAPTCRPTCSTR